MEKDMQQLHQIRASRETLEALAKWCDDGNIKTLIPRPLEYGVLIFDELEYVLFDRHEDDVRFIWYQNDQPYAKFDYNLEDYRLDNIGTILPMEPSEEVYKPFFNITSTYCGVMAFIIANVEDNKAVEVTHNGDQRIYTLSHLNSKLGEMSVADSARGQIQHQLTFGKHA